MLISRAHLEEMCAHALAENPSECVGLLGGALVREGASEARSVYRLRNVAPDTRVRYEAAPEELFAAQRLMRARNEALVGIYHSHPQQDDPTPSETDVRLAFYPSAIYFIIGLGSGACVVRAFRLFESEGRWERVAYRVSDGVG